MVELYGELERKQQTRITREVLEKNGFENPVPRITLPFKTWRLKAIPYFWFDEYEVDRNYLDDGDFGLVKNGTFLLSLATKRTDLTSVADLEDALDLCGIDKEIDV